MARTFRKPFGSFQQWHFHRSCLGWPVARFIELPELPMGIDLCPECVLLFGRDSALEELRTQNVSVSELSQAA
jgi:hypothetical protein